MRNKSIFDKLDDWLEAKGNVQNYFILALVLCGVIIYFIISPMSQEYFDDKENKLNTTTTNLINAQNSLNDFRPLENGQYGRIIEERDTLKREENKLNETVDANNYLDDKLRQASAVTYNQENWAKFLDSLTTLAENNNVKVFSITSDLKEPKKLEFKPQAMLDVKVAFEGTYHNVLKYINFIEQSEMIVDVNQLDINATSNGKIGGSLGVSVWGVNYQ